MHLIEERKPFAESRIWQFQRDFFNEAGIEAWRSGVVPHYVSSNPVVGRTYAELVLALLRDLALRGRTDKPVYLLELGAGHGRLCYHFFKHFEKYYEQSAIALPPLCYVLSDFTEANIGFWREHPRLQPYLEKGWLDFALFDVERDREIRLEAAGRTLGLHSLDQPLLIVANYFFDTIPQDLFKIDEQGLSRCLLTLGASADPATLDTASLIAGLELQYDYADTESPIYPDEPGLNDLLEKCGVQFERTHLLFPIAGLRCLDRLREISRSGMVLLSADKGEHHVSALDRRKAPKLVAHGSFSLSVNYHALAEYCEGHGGLALFPRHLQSSLDLGCLLFLPDASSYRETLQAYERFVGDYGPDDYFSLKRVIEPHFSAMSFRDIQAAIRLSGYDARIFQQMLPRLRECLPSLKDAERSSLLLAIPRIWDTYYPLGETADLAASLGDLLLALHFYQAAILYFQKSILIYGREARTVYKIALCHYKLKEYGAAASLLAELRVDHPDNEYVKKLGRRVEAGLAV